MLVHCHVNFWLSPALTLNPLHIVEHPAVVSFISKFAQVDRKRHVGNDIVLIVFLDGQSKLTSVRGFLPLIVLDTNLMLSSLLSYM